MNRPEPSASAAYPKSITAIIHALALLLFAWGGVFNDIPLFSYLLILVFFVFVAITTRSKAVFLLLALPGIAGFLFLPVSALALFYAAIGVIGVTASVIRQKMCLLLLAFPVAYGIAFAMVGDPVQAVGTLIFLPPALVMGVLLKKEARRGNMIALGTAALLVLVAGALAAFVYTKTGTVTAEALLTIIEDIRKALIPEMLPLFEEMGMPMSEELLSEAFHAVILLLPAAAVVICELISYLGSLLGVWLAIAAQDTLPLRTAVFRMEPVSAILFLLAGLVTLLAPVDGMVGPIAHNLYIILLPGLALGEIFSVAAGLHEKRARMAPMLLILICILAGGILPDLLALLGAFGLIKSLLPPHSPSAEQ